jgi:flagellar biosynthesis/type III secretory pathway chaperone
MTTTSEGLSDLLLELRLILEKERSVLLSGAPARITSIAERKLALAEAIEAQCAKPGAVVPGTEELRWLYRYNSENSVICSAVIRHLSLAHDKLRQHELHRSYGPDGTESSPASQNSLGAA